MTLPRFYPIVDTDSLMRRDCDPVSAAHAMIEGGAGLLQFRYKGPFTRAVLTQAARITQLCRDAGTLLIINDRADIALLLDAGVHVGQEDLPAADARRLMGAGRIVGFSTHGLEQFAAGLSEPVDYLAAGPVFATSSKDDAEAPVGLEGIRALAASRAAGSVHLPLVAIGGITRANAREVLQAGADSVAVIRDILPDNCTFQAIRERVEEWQRLVTK